MAVIDSTIKITNSEQVDTLLKARLKTGFQYKDVDLPEDWKNNETTLVFKANDFDGILEILDQIKTDISAIDLQTIYSPEGISYFIRYKI